MQLTFATTFRPTYRYAYVCRGNWQFGIAGSFNVQVLHVGTRQPSYFTSQRMAKALYALVAIERDTLVKRVCGSAIPADIIVGR